MNQLTNWGHLPGCQSSRIPNSLRPKCPAVVKSRPGGKCGAQATKQACIFSSDDELISRCWAHWKPYCDDIGFDSDLSRCANTVCLRMGISSKRINHLNIQDLLGLPGDKKYNHVSKRRRREAEAELAAKNLKRVLIDLVDSDSGETRPPGETAEELELIEAPERKFKRLDHMDQ